MKTFFSISFFFLSFTSYSQDCNCASNFNWVKETFEANDAGYQYIIDKKGTQAYELHNQIFIQKVKSTEDVQECHGIINEWLQFFRKGHIGLEYVGSAETWRTKKEGEELAEQKIAEPWETYSINIDDFKNYLTKKPVQDLEGIWQTGSYEIGIKKEANEYIGFIVSSKVQEWQPKELKLKIIEADKSLQSVFYMFDRTAVESEQNELIGKNYLQVGDIILNRIYPVIPLEYDYQLHFKALDSELPFIEEINEKTLYFRIPSFTGTPEKTAIDSVIAHNRAKILSTENLIIDIRNGTGGSDNSFYELLPLIYTNPMRMPKVEFRSTILNNQRMLDFSRNEGLTKDFNMVFTEEERKEFKANYEKLEKNIGGFVNLDSIDVRITRFDTIHPFPKNVGIIHNHRNGSTDEQFLLEAKQSRKVKTFGRTTGGMLDVGNMNITNSPCGDFRLWYTLSKSLRIPEMIVDDIGVQPDYYLDKQIPEHEWINYVSKILNE